LNVAIGRQELARKKRTVIIKLGGSVITDKRVAFKANFRSMHRIARELARVRHMLILLNGAGSFGHIAVKRSGLDEGFGREKKRSFARTKLQLLRLQEILVSVLCSHGIPVVPFTPSSFMIARSGRLYRAELAPIHEFLELGLVPLFGGDLVPDLDQGWRVVSADQMAAWIAPRIGASTIIYGTDVDGLYSSDPRLCRDAELLETIPCREIPRIARSTLGSRMPDVTAGMQGKLLEAEHAARKGVEVVIMNLRRPENLHRILEGRDGRWTRIPPENRRSE
jgi:isopentenyl phosphate kinase